MTRRFPASRASKRVSAAAEPATTRYDPWVLRLRLALGTARRGHVAALLTALLVATVVLFGVGHDSGHAFDDAGIACIVIGAVFVAKALRVLVQPATRGARPVRRPTTRVQVPAQLPTVVPQRAPIPLRL